MKMRLMRKIGKREEEHKVEKDNWEEEVVQHSGEGESLEGDKNMAKFKEVQEKTDEELAKNARLKMGGFNSLSNSIKSKEDNKLKREMRSRLKKMNNAEDKFWEFENVQVVLRDNRPYKYTVSLSCMQLAQMYISGNLIYDPQVQRGSHTNKKGEEVPILFLKHCRNIQSSILDGSIHGGNLSLNFPTDNNAELFYDNENMTLSGEGPITINDGMHRIYSCVLWYKDFLKPNSTCKSPESFYFPVNIEHISKLESEDLFREYAVMGKSISKNRVSVHNVFDKNYEIAQRVMNESQLKGKVEMISNSIKKSSPYILTYGTILGGVAEFKIATKKEESITGDFIIKFWDHLIELFPRLMGNVDSETRAIEKQNSFALEKMFMNSYFILGSQLQGKDDWMIRLERLTQNNFLSRSNPIWSFCLREGEKIVNSSKVQKDITEIMIEKVMAK